MKMKKQFYFYTLAALLLISAKGIFAQDEAFIAGASGAMYVPIGTLADRYKTTVGGSFYFGREVSESWSWVGKFEYFKFNKLNGDNLYKQKYVMIKGAEILLPPLNDLKMDFECFGLSANAGYKVFANDLIQTDLELGFGVYRWYNKRSEFNAKIDTSGTGKTYNLNVPANDEEDWSAGLNLGLGVSVQVYKPVSLYVSANYKMIIGELWPALALDLENVSSLQIIELKAGVRARF
jgi:hypothetical protein